jgi:hypothetical protein
VAVVDEQQLPDKSRTLSIGDILPMFATSTEQEAEKSRSLSIGDILPMFATSTEQDKLGDNKLDDKLGGEDKLGEDNGQKNAGLIFGIRGFGLYESLMEETEEDKDTATTVTPSEGTLEKRRTIAATAVGATTCAIAGGTASGAVGAAAGGIAGGLAGVPFAIFTFGLSIPVGAVVGGTVGGGAGVATGGSVGAVVGGTVGYQGYKHKDELSAKKDEVCLKINAKKEEVCATICAKKQELSVKFPAFSKKVE